MKLLILATIWLLGAICDRVWFFWDKSIPSWDQADYLTGSLNYLQALQNPDLLNGEWWQNLWLLSSKIPPFTYIVTAFIQDFYGKGYDEATLVMLGFSAVLILSVYGLGKVLFSETVGLWAAALCQVMPGLYRYRLEFLLDYPLAAVVTLSFFCLTLWFFTNNPSLTSPSLPLSPSSSLRCNLRFILRFSVDGQANSIIFPDNPNNSGGNYIDKKTFVGKTLTINWCFWFININIWLVVSY